MTASSCAIAGAALALFGLAMFVPSLVAAAVAWVLEEKR